ncbi:MAG TPA: SoxR reducing system RseC family protein [Spirochaetota bacterium]|mgnify:CR=1 FL=1|nr:SoxR reducing system RseC family protein [Spirochaetota bacterium]HPJ34818.1 SoxR reducing system RseC family protein [Spirochaetota bacterium]
MERNINQEYQEDLGFVLQLDGDLARVRVAPNADCDNCGSCSTVHMEIFAYNPVMAKPGQKIRFTRSQQGMFKIAFMIFMLPLLSIFAGLYAGSVAASFLGFNEPLMMFAGVAFFLSAAIYSVYFYDRSYKENKNNLPRIVEVINQQ